MPTIGRSFTAYTAAHTPKTNKAITNALIFTVFKKKITHSQEKINLKKKMKRKKRKNTSSEKRQQGENNHENTEEKQHTYNSLKEYVFKVLLLACCLTVLPCANIQKKIICLLRSGSSLCASSEYAWHCNGSCCQCADGSSEEEGG